MLRKSIYSVLTLMLCCSFANAQTFKTWQSPKLEIKDINAYLCSDETGHYTWEYEWVKKGKNFKNFIKLNHFGQDFQLKTSKEVAFEQEGAWHKTMDFFKFGQQFAWLLEGHDKNKDDVTFFNIVPVGLDGTAKPAVTAIKMSGWPTVEWFRSADGSKLLLVATKTETMTAKLSYKKPLETHLAVLDADYKLLWSKAIVWESPDTQTKTSSWAVTSNGDVLFTTDLYEADLVKKHLTDRDTFPSASRLYKMAKADKKPIEVPIYNGKGRVNGCALYAAPGSSEANCACFYSDQPNDGFHGILTLGISVADAKVTSERKTVFDTGVFDSFGKRNVDKSGDGLRSTFELQHIVPRPDGGLLLYAEVAANVLFATYSIYEMNWVRGDIALFDLDANGSLRRKAVFPRDLTFEGKYFMGTNGEADAYSKYLSTMYYNHKGSFYLGNDGQVYVRYFQADTSPKKNAKLKYDEMTLGTLHKDGKVTNQVMKEKAGPSTGPAPKLPLDKPETFNILCRKLDNKYLQFEVRYLGDEVR